MPVNQKKLNQLTNSYTFWGAKFSYTLLSPVTQALLSIFFAEFTFMQWFALHWLVFEFRLWSLDGFVVLFFDVSEEFLTLLDESLFFFLQLQSVQSDVMLYIKAGKHAKIRQMKPDIFSNILIKRHQEFKNRPPGQAVTCLSLERRLEVGSIRTLLLTARLRYDMSSKRDMLPGRDGAGKGPANSLQASA